MRRSRRARRRSGKKAVHAVTVAVSSVYFLRQGEDVIACGNDIRRNARSQLAAMQVRCLVVGRQQRRSVRRGMRGWSQEKGDDLSRFSRLEVTLYEYNSTAEGTELSDE